MMMFIALVFCLLLSVQQSVSFNMGVPMGARRGLSKVATMAVADTVPKVEKTKKEVI